MKEIQADNFDVADSSFKNSDEKEVQSEQVVKGCPADVEKISEDQGIEKEEEISCDYCE